MIKQHSQLLQLSLGTCDLAVVALAWTAAYELRFQFFPSDAIPPQATEGTNLVITLLVSLVVMAGMGLYKPKRDKSFLLELGQVIKASSLTWIIVIAAIAFTNESRFTRGMLLMFLPCVMVGLIVERGCFRSLLRTIRRRGWNLRHALVVGTGRLAQSTQLKLQANTWTGVRVAGFISIPGEPERQEVRGLPVMGTLDKLVEIVQTRKIDCVFIALPSEQAEHMRSAIGMLEQTSVDVRIIPDLFLSRFPMNVSAGELDGLPILSLRENPLAGWPAIYKRAFDIAGALFALALFGLPMLVIALAIKLTSAGPVIFRQQRVSVGGRPFDMYKFRTMVIDAEPTGAVFAEKNDPRCTRLGKWLRGASLDELPQFLNVLKGDMSLVGPRPERPEMMERIQHEIPGFPVRLKVRAGLTGWAQVNGFRGRTSFRKRLQYDLYYLNHWSPMFDVRIVLATMFQGFRHPNAY